MSFAAAHSRRVAWLALLAMVLRLCTPLLHGGEHCARGHHVADVEVCACGAVHGHAAGGGAAAGGEHGDDERDEHVCAACMLEHEAPGGAPLQAVAVPATAWAIAFEGACAGLLVRLHERAAPPPRGPPGRG